jgi:hypothetical protein
MDTGGCPEKHPARETTFCLIINRVVSPAKPVQKFNLLFPAG